MNLSDKNFHDKEACNAFDKPRLLTIVDRCPLCNSQDSEIFLSDVRDYYFNADKGNFFFKKCLDCNSIWLAQRPFGERLLRAYANYYTHTATASKSVANPVRRALRALYGQSRFGAAPALFSRLMDWAARLGGRTHLGLEHHFRFAPRAPARILDYGCGGGDYLLRMQPFGYQLFGLEYDPHLIGGLAGKGIQIEDVGTIGADRWDAEFDHITLSHVFEHVPDPAPLLQRLFRWLKPGGTLFIEVPNADATGLEIFGRYWRGLEVPRHFMLPTRAALVQALHGSGYVSPRQFIGASTRRGMWDLSLSVAPAGEQSMLRARMAAAPAETFDNAEFLTFVVARPRGS